MNRITFRNDTGEVRALLSDVTFKNFVGLFDTEILMLQGSSERRPDGMREYVFIMPDDHRRPLLEEFLRRCDLCNVIEHSLN
jgi:hypothetical protein